MKREDLLKLFLFLVLGLLFLTLLAGLSGTWRLRALALREERLAQRNLGDESASLHRVVFAVSRLMGFRAVGDEALAERAELARAVVGHAALPNFLDRSAIEAMLGDDPLLLRPRLGQLEREYALQVQGLELALQRIAASTGREEKRAALEGFEALSAALLPHLERRSQLLLQLESYYFARHRDLRGKEHYYLNLFFLGHGLAALLAAAAALLVFRSQRRQVNRLRGLIPICASCKKVRDDRGYWKQVEDYIRSRSEASFSHGICPECMRRLYPEVAD